VWGSAAAAVELMQPAVQVRMGERGYVSWERAGVVCVWVCGGEFNVGAKRGKGVAQIIARVIAQAMAQVKAQAIAQTACVRWAHPPGPPGLSSR
jgi:hypothetical protein